MFSIMAAGCRGAWKTAAPADRITCMLSRTLPDAALFWFNLRAFGADYGSDRSRLMRDTLIFGGSGSYLHHLAFLRVCGNFFG